MTLALWEDLRYAWRALFRNPAFSIIAATTLAVGIGANVAVFSLVNAVLLRPLPYRDPDRLAFVSIDPNDGTAGIYYGNYAALAAQTAVFDGVAWYYRNSGWSRVTITGGEPETAQGAFVSANVFPLMGVTAAIGRALAVSDEARREHAVVLSDRLAGVLRAAVRALDATAILSPVTTLEQQIDRQLAPRRFQAWLLGLFSLTALGLAGVGIYGVMHYAAAERRREIGIRMALGAQQYTVLGMMIREALRLASFGLAAGLAGAFWVSRLIANLLFGITSWDPRSFAAAAAFLLVVAVLASAWPAWRAARVDPLIALRMD